MNNFGEWLRKELETKRISQTELAYQIGVILHDDPTTVNRLLTALCETITITPMYELNIVWR